MVKSEFAEFGSRMIISASGQELEVIFIKADGEDLVFKLPSGYNVRFQSSAVKVLKQLDTAGAGHKSQTEQAVFGTGDRKVGLLSTGGTISSRIDYATGAVKPTKDISFIREAIEDIESQISLRAEIVESILSENMSPDHWVRIARHVKKSLESGEAVVLLHGTDTMTYTSSALSFMFEKQEHPIVMTGSQRSPDRPSTDAFENIGYSIRFSLETIGEVGICMHSSISDGESTLIRGVRARKMHTSRRDAFRAIGGGTIGRMLERKAEILDVRKPPDSETLLHEKLDKAAGIYYFNPLSTGEDLERFASGRKVIVIMATGLGHVSEILLPEIRELTEGGKHVLVTSQCIYGRVDLNVYASGRHLTQAGAIPLQDMLPEVALTKSMYLLANYPDDFRSLITKDLRGEVTARSVGEAYLP